MRYFFLVLLISGFSSVMAQTFTPVKDVAATEKRISEASAKINSIQCDFTQEKVTTMLTEKAVSKGKFYFKKESKVRLEYQTPVKNLIVMSSGKMMMQDDKKTSQMDMHRSKMFQQLNNIIVGSINGNLFSGKDFTATYSENNTLIKVQLKPINKMMRNFLSEIVLVLDKKDFTATRIEMNEPGGDSTILQFSGKQLNTSLNDSLFAVK
jgi:outer membrane lipoprotein-sorting protein